MKEFFFGPPQVYGLLYRVLQEDRPTVRLYELADDDAVQFAHKCLILIEVNVFVDKCHNLR